MRAFMPRFAANLKETAETFNQSADTWLDVEIRGQGGRVDSIRLYFDDGGYMFTPAGGGVLRVDRIESGGKTPYALLRPRLDGTGHLHEWREQQLCNGRQIVRRSSEELCEHYVLSAVRARLLAGA